MKNYWEAEVIAALKCCENDPNVNILGSSTDFYELKEAKKLGDYSQTSAFDFGRAEITHAVAEISNADVYMPNGFIGVDEKYLIEESLWQAAIHKRNDVIVNKDTGWRHHIRRPADETIERVEKEGILFAHHRFYYQYFHWFIDCLPRLWLAREQKVNFLDFYCGEFGENSFQQKSINLLGIKKKSLNFGAGTKVLKFKSLLYPFSTLKESLKVRPSFRDGIHHKGGWHPAYLMDINDIITANCTSKKRERGKKLYIKRPNSGHRRLLNADLFEAYLSEAGFCFVDPGQHSFEVQVQMFNDAEFVVAAHGAGLTNLLWSNPSKLKGVFEITIDGIFDTGYTFISSGLGFSHYIFPAKPTFHRHGPAFADLEFDASQAVQALKSIL